MPLLRYLNDDLCEMVCTLQIGAAQILKAPLAYKYVIFSPVMASEDDCYEYLHSLNEKVPSNPNLNRCLWIVEAHGGNGIK